METINILITGACGQLGHEMRNVLTDDQRFNVVYTDVAGEDIITLDITVDGRRIRIVDEPTLRNISRFG